MCFYIRIDYDQCKCSPKRWFEVRSQCDKMQKQGKQRFCDNFTPADPNWTPAKMWCPQCCHLKYVIPGNIDPTKRAVDPSDIASALNALQVSAGAPTPRGSMQSGDGASTPRGSMRSGAAASSPAGSMQLDPAAPSPRGSMQVDPAASSPRGSPARHIFTSRAAGPSRLGTSQAGASQQGTGQAKGGGKRGRDSSHSPPARNKTLR